MTNCRLPPKRDREWSSLAKYLLTLWERRIIRIVSVPFSYERDKENESDPESDPESGGRRSVNRIRRRDTISKERRPYEAPETERGH